ncbi:MAG: rRNA pseudouridine synthase [Acidobacteria bacterium]|nr:rRNA pseudouridine synthase [Acidobacteriota bacterium]
MPERLQKIISSAGIASRRKAEQLIVEGRVTVNGKIVTELGTKAEFGVDHIKVDGKLLHPPQEFHYIAMNKPVGVVTTMSDPEGRPTVADLLRGVKQRVYPVGRLDYNSEGLLLLTNDGDFAKAVMAAKSELVKTYVVKVTASLTLEQEEQFRRGVYLSGKKTAPAGLKKLKHAINPWYEVQLVEGRQNQIRMMFRSFGVLVEKLKRVKIGFLELGPLRPREFRPLTPKEVARFCRILHLKIAEDE